MAALEQRLAKIASVQVATSDASRERAEQALSVLLDKTKAEKQAALERERAHAHEAAALQHRLQEVEKDAASWRAAQLLSKHNHEEARREERGGLDADEERRARSEAMRISLEMDRTATNELHKARMQAGRRQRAEQVSNSSSVRPSPLHSPIPVQNHHNSVQTVINNQITPLFE